MTKVTEPRMVMSTALTIPMTRLKWGLSPILPVSFRACDKMTPSVIITNPNPRLNNSAMVNPSAIRPAAMATKSAAMAAGQGTSPPETPSNNKSHFLN